MSNVRRKGSAAEKIAKFRLSMFNEKVERTGRGSDFKTTNRDIWTGKTETRYHEVKTSKAKLSKLQKITKKKLGKKYNVIREDPLFW